MCFINVFDSFILVIIILNTFKFTSPVLFGKHVSSNKSLRVIYDSHKWIVTEALNKFA